MDKAGALKKPRINAIEYMRGISMLGVIGIHVGSQYIVNAAANIHLVAVFEIFTRFSVPIFFFISAFGLFYNLDINKSLNYKNFMKKRARTVIVPYVAWSLLYVVFYVWRYHAFSLLNPLQLLSMLFFGTACYQLYFMVILIWFYLLMPLWKYMVKHSSCINLTVLLVLQIAFDYYSSFVMNPYGIANPVLRDLLVYRLNYWVLHYIFIFVLGGYLAVHYDDFKIFMKHYRLSIAAFFFVSLLGLLAYYYYCLFIENYTVLEAINTAHQLSPAGVFYTIGASIFLFSEFYNCKLPRLLEKAFSLLGRHSYFAYLCHPVFIALLAAVMVKLNMVMTAYNSIAFYLGTVVLSVIAAAVCRYFSQKYWPILNELTIGVYAKR
ncbi:acyltransferase [Pectinatus frisingensis]|uniref:acyltransferase n=1 Tax=Pectinatus frisingensis TaxID=865 RepID=UPI0015F40E4A|nr:acyltransferase [Pectinatus frisingensis]